METVKDTVRAMRRAKIYMGCSADGCGGRGEYVVMMNDGNTLHGCEKHKREMICDGEKTKFINAVRY